MTPLAYAQHAYVQREEAHAFLDQLLDGLCRRHGLDPWKAYDKETRFHRTTLAMLREPVRQARVLEEEQAKARWERNMREYTLATRVSMLVLPPQDFAIITGVVA